MMFFAKLPRRIISFSYDLVSKNRFYSFASSFFQIRSYTSMQAKLIFLMDGPTKSVISRHVYKSKKKKFGREDDESSDDEGDDDVDDNEDGAGELEEKGVEVKTLKIPSLRMDYVLKTAFGYRRKQIEKSFYETKIRVNGKLLLKKGANVKIGDEVDIIKDFAPSSSDLLTIARIEILDIFTDKENEKFKVKIKKTKSLVIDNYSGFNRWRRDESKVET